VEHVLLSGESSAVEASYLCEEYEVSVATTDEHRATQDSIRSWATKAQPLNAVRAADPDAQRKRWTEFAALGFLAVGLSEKCGGEGRNDGRPRDAEAGRPEIRIRAEQIACSSN